MNRIPLVFASLALISCADVHDRVRPTDHVYNEGAKGTNQGLGYVALGVRQTTHHVHDVADDTVGYGGRVTDKQARNYTRIGFDSVRRSEDLAHRESKRYTKLALDTYDKAANQELRTSHHWFDFAGDTSERAFATTRRIHQGTLKDYGEAVDRSYFSFWKIFNPPETLPYMVGSKNDCIKCCGPFAKVPGGVWTKDLQVAEVQEMPSEKNPVRNIK